MNKLAGDRNVSLIVLTKVLAVFFVILILESDERMLYGVV